jgi:hypothetical protein
MSQSINWFPNKITQVKTLLIQHVVLITTYNNTRKTLPSQRIIVTI